MAEINGMADYGSPPVRVGRRLWRLWEKAFEMLARIEDPGGADCFLRLALRRYRGPLRVLPDGTRLAGGDLVGELHIKNEYVQSLTGGGEAGRSVALTLKVARHSLAVLAAVVRDDPRYRDIKALVGYTMLHRGIKRVGFSVFELSLGMRIATAIYERWLIVLYHRDGWRHVRRYWHKLVPKLVVLSRGQLMGWLGVQRGGPAEEDRRPAGEEGGHAYA